MSAPAAILVTVAAGLWPFGGGDAGDATVGSLQRKPAAIELRREVPDSTA